MERGELPIDQACELLRNGLRALNERQMPALRGFGNSFIWGKSPQNARAIDLMYHAAGSTNSHLVHNAVYFGLSTVRPMTDPILRTLVDLSMRSEDPNLLSRVAWGASSQKAELLRHLEPYLNSTDTAQRDHAEDLRRIFNGEIQAFVWAAEHAKAKAQENFGSRLEEVRGDLASGDSKTRRETLDLIQRERIILIMDESFISAFAAAGQDADPKVRKEATMLAGSHWVWESTNQPAAAIDLMIRQSRDVSSEVRHDALYYGLSTVKKRNDRVIERMLEMALLDGINGSDLRRRIAWGLREEKSSLRRVLEKWIQGSDQIRALFAYGMYLDVFAAQPDALGSVTDLLQTPDKPVARLIGFVPTAGWNPSSSQELLTTLREQLPAPHNDRFATASGMPFIIAAESEVAAIKNAMIKSPRLKVAIERPLPVEAIIHIGKTGNLKTFDK